MPRPIAALPDGNASAQREFHDTTAEARRLYERAMGELTSLGEITEETDAVLTQFQFTEIMAENPLAPLAADLAVIHKALARV